MTQSKLGRNSSARKALFRSVLVAFFKHGRIETTETKAKVIGSLAEKLITLAKREDLHARRQVIAALVDKEVAKKLFDEIAPQYKERNGGYTRILKLGVRRGDAAPMALLELVK